MRFLRHVRSADGEYNRPRRQSPSITITRRPNFKSRPVEVHAGIGRWSYDPRFPRPEHPYRCCNGPPWPRQRACLVGSRASRPTQLCPQAGGAARLCADCAPSRTGRRRAVRPGSCALRREVAREWDGQGTCAESTFRQLGQDRPGQHARGGSGALSPTPPMPMGGSAPGGQAWADPARQSCRV